MKTRRELIHAEVLALERDFASFWSRFPDQRPTRTRVDLPILQRALDLGAIQLDTDRDRRALGIALGMVAVQELGLGWIRLGDEWGVEWALAREGSPVVAHPLPMIANRADDGRAIQLVSLLDAIASLYVPAAPTPPGTVLAWRAEFGRPGPGIPALERALGTLAAALQTGADLSFVLIRGATFTVTVDAGRGNAHDLTMQMSFAGDRAMLVVGGGRAHDLGIDGTTLHDRTRHEIERLIDCHLDAHPEAAADFAPLTTDLLD